MICYQCSIMKNVKEKSHVNISMILNTQDYTNNLNDILDYTYKQIYILAFYDQKIVNKILMKEAYHR